MGTAFKKAFIAFIGLEDLTPQTDTQTLAIDGKTLCGSRKQDATITHRFGRQPVLIGVIQTSPNTGRSQKRCRSLVDFSGILVAVLGACMPERTLWLSVALTFWH